ncbi:hypothetical protein MC7420_836 [Coleofasciculus chthonoplastes PCC 7420]|uniref:Uncharacterized protein n=1 Tax=Coleofasciculus chthonoplastes PCC 7420 TaxID=118168 RepID=B4VSY2_9CYAN|nr:hypothetical protein MC7420_836 [Coleofasciculus chthonoplastes PCC 7420]
MTGVGSGTRLLCSLPKVFRGILLLGIDHAFLYMHRSRAMPLHVCQLIVGAGLGTKTQ